MGSARCTDSGQGGAGRLPGRVTGEQLAEDDVLLGAAQQPRRGVTDQGRRLAQDAEAERLVGAGQRRGRGAAEPGRDGVAQPGGREPGGSEQEAAVGAWPLRASTRWATTSTATVDRPVPGAPSTRSTGPRCSTTARWLASSTGAGAATGGGTTEDEHPGIPPRRPDTGTPG